MASGVIEASASQGEIWRQSMANGVNGDVMANAPGHAVVVLKKSIENVIVHHHRMGVIIVWVNESSIVVVAPKNVRLEHLIFGKSL